MSKENYTWQVLESVPGVEKRGACFDEDGRPLNEEDYSTDSLKWYETVYSYYWDGERIESPDSILRQQPVDWLKEQFIRVLKMPMHCHREYVIRAVMAATECPRIVASLAESKDYDSILALIEEYVQCVLLAEKIAGGLRMSPERPGYAQIMGAKGWSKFIPISEIVNSEIPTN